MNYCASIWARTALILLLSAFISTATLGGFARAGVECCGECCRSQAHHPIQGAGEKLSAETSALGCKGMTDAPCDLSAQGGSKGRLSVWAIPSATGVGPTISASGNLSKVIADPIAFQNGYTSRVSMETIPIFLETRSLII